MPWKITHEGHTIIHFIHTIKNVPCLCQINIQRCKRLDVLCPRLRYVRYTKQALPVAQGRRTPTKQIAYCVNNIFSFVYIPRYCR